MEHSAFDGHTTTRYAEDMFNHSVRTRCDSPSNFSLFNTSNTQRTSAPPVHKLEFRIPNDIREEIDRVTVEFNQLAGRCHHAIVHFVPFGKRFIIQQKLSPDAFIQLSYHLTYYRLTGAIGSAYESAMTKQFYHGRTECMRSLSSDIVAFLKMVSDPSSSALDQIKAMKTALNTHGHLVNAAKKGEGVDRHLWGLCQLAKQQQQRVAGYTMPEIYQDIAWTRMRYDIMSTSNCGGYALQSFGFGPVVPDGFGIGYIIKDKCMHFHITNYDADKSNKYANLLEESLLYLAQLVTNGTPIHLHMGKSKL